MFDQEKYNHYVKNIRPQIYKNLYKNLKWWQVIIVKLSYLKHKLFWMILNK